MKFERINMRHGIIVWISGIYKITSYQPGQYHAYFIQEWFTNWGDNVETPPAQKNGREYYKTRKQAEAACKRHQKDYTPSSRIVKRAAFILETLKEEYS